MTITAATALLNSRIERNLMGRQYSLFSMGTPKEKLALGLCPQGRCTGKIDEEWDGSMTISCCCVTCFNINKVTNAKGVTRCLDCPTIGESGG